MVGKPEIVESSVWPQLPERNYKKHSPSDYLDILDRMYESGEFREASRLMREKMRGERKTPSEYLAMADKRYARGEYMAASRLMWKATETLFMDIADARGMDYTQDFIAVARALEKAEDVPKLPYRGGLSTAKLLRDHAEMDLLEDEEVEFSYGLAREFIVWNCDDVE